MSYLRERFDFAVHEPTPLEASAYLQQRGLSTESAEKANNFFTACDAARFAPCGQPGNQAWTTRATSLLQALEEESWSAQAT